MTANISVRYLQISGTTYLNQITSHILPGKETLEANEIKKMTVNKSKRSQLFVVSKMKKPQDRSYQHE